MQFHPNDLSDLDELTEEHLGFSALSDGLGFSKGKTTPHPATQKGMTAPKSVELEDFDEDALELSSSGIGAVAAGPARPAPAPAPSLNNMYSSTNAHANTNTASAAPSYTQAKSPMSAPLLKQPLIAKPNMTAPVAKATQTATAAKIAPAKPATAAQVLAEPAAPRTLRVAAFLLDATFVAAPMALAWLVSFRGEAREIFLQDPTTPVGLLAVIFAAYFLLSESFGGQSLGKMIVGLHVVEDDKYQKTTGFKHALIRLGLFIVGAACFGLGFFASFWDSKRRPWHDRYSGSIVRRTNN